MPKFKENRSHRSHHTKSDAYLTLNHVRKALTDGLAILQSGGNGPKGK